MYPAPPGAHSFTASPLPSLPPHPRHAGFRNGSSGAPCQVLSSAQHHWAQHHRHQTGGPVSRGSVPRSGFAAPRRVRAESLVLCTHSCAPCHEQELTHTAHPHECTRAHSCACEQCPAPRCSPCRHTLHEAACSTAVPAHAGPSPLTRTHSCQHSAGHPAGQPTGQAAVPPSPALSSAENPAQSSQAPCLLTVKMLERRLDCLRMGVGVLEAAMVSIRSSRWLMLGVEGTEEE